MNPVDLRSWGLAHNIPFAAIVDLEKRMGLHSAFNDPLPLPPSKSEAYVQSKVRLAAAAEGIKAWRNNVGALTDGDSGRPVRFGLANDSPALNKHLKSSDLIGWRPVLIEARHMGTRLAQFWCRECKEPGWAYTGTDRELAQRRWIEAVLADGGDAAFVSEAP